MHRNDQPDLFGQSPSEGAYGMPPPNMLAASADPSTSASAAQEHVQSGRRGANAERVLALVRAQPGSTSVELYTAQAGATDRMDRVEISRRLSDLSQAGAVVHGEARTCRIANRAMVVWFAVEDVADFPP